MAMLARFQEPLFAMFYIMTEHKDNRPSKRTMHMCRFGLLLLVDAGQVLRAIYLPRFGWNPTLSAYLKRFDVIRLVLSAIPEPIIPNVLFFVLGVSLVFLALLDAAYVIRSFQKGRATRLWTVVFLRLLVATMVTTFFISILRWILFPLRCPSGNDVSKDTLSTWFSGDPDAPCTPWGDQEAAISVVALFVALAFVAFSLATTLFTFEVDPTSEAPADKFTGRVEALWSTVRVSAVLVEFAESKIIVLAFLVFLCLHSAAAFAAHIKVLPFHSHDMNLLRGGIHLMVFWAALSSTVVFSTTADGKEPQAFVETILVSMIPASFVLGCGAVKVRRDRALSNLKRLRGDFLKGSGLSCGGRGAEPGAAADAMCTAVRGGSFEEFYDAESKLYNAFESSSGANLGMRVLLYCRDPRDKEFMRFLFAKVLEDHPRSQSLQVLHSQFLHFVFKDGADVKAARGLSKAVESELFLDLKYALYAASRRAVRLNAGVNLGKDSLSPVSLIEVSSKLKHVHKEHKECVVLLVKMWKVAIHLKRSTSQHEVAHFFSCFDKVSDNIIHTRKCYEELLVKFPGSASLHLDYAQFCEAILNDPFKAAQQRRGAELLEDGAEAFDDNKSQAKSNPSSATSRDDTQRRFVQSWSHLVMAKEGSALRRLRFLAISLGLFLLVFSAAAFIIQDVYLLNTLTVSRLDLMHSTSGYLLYIAQLAVYLRDMFLAANGMDTLTSQTLDQARQSALQCASNIGNLHISNYRSLTSSDLTKFMSDLLMKETIAVPSANRFDAVSVSYWSLINDLVSATISAASIKLQDLQDPNYSVDTMSDEKRSIAFVLNNVVEASRGAQIFNSLVLSEITDLQAILDRYVAGLLCANVASLVLFSYLLIHNVRRVFPTCQHAATAGGLLYSLPLSVLTKACKHYTRIAKAMEALEDEAVDKHIVEQGPDSGVDHSDHFDYSRPRTCARRPSCISLASPRQTEERGEVQAGKLERRGSTGVRACDPPVERRISFAGQDDAAACDEAAAAAALADSAQRRPRPEKDARAQPSLDAPAASERPAAVVDDSPWKPEYSSGSRAGSGSKTLSSGLSAQATLRGDDVVGEESRGPSSPQASQAGNRGRRPPATDAQWPFCGPDKAVRPRAADRSGSESRSDRCFGAPLPSPTAACRGGRAARQGDCSSGDDGSEADPFWDCPSRGGSARTPSGAGSSREESEPAPDFDEVAAAAVVRFQPGFGRNVPCSRVARRDAVLDDGACERDESDGDEEMEAVPREGRGGKRSMEGIGNESGEGSRDGEERRGREGAREVALRFAPGEPESWLESDSEASASASPRGRPDGNELTYSEDDDAYSDVDTACGGRGRRDGGALKDDPSRFALWTARMRARLEDKGHALSKDRPDNADSFSARLNQESQGHLAWYFRTHVYVAALLAVLALCFVVWLAPRRFIPQLINTVLLQKSVRQARYLVLGVVLEVRELGINDGFGRVNGNTSFLYSAALRGMLKQEMDNFRYGTGDVQVGADYLDSDAMNAYFNAMYQPGCPWRQNTSDCSMKAWPQAASQGLYNLLVSFTKGTDIVLGKYAPIRSDPGTNRVRFDPIIPNRTRAAQLLQDRDFSFVIEGEGDDEAHGLDQLVSIFSTEQARLLAAMHDEVKMLITFYVLSIVAILYVLLYRVGMASARRELNKTTNFVNILPFHVLSRQDAELVRAFFVSDDSEADRAARWDIRSSGEFPAV